MKKQLLSLGIIALSGFSLNAQCGGTELSPAVIDDTLAARGTTWGAIPDTTTNLPAGAAGTLYDEVLSFKLPSDAGELDPQYSGVSLEDIRVKSVSGLPPGLTFIARDDATDDFYCDGSAGPSGQPGTPQTCWWAGGAYGCVRIQGTIAAGAPVGDYPLDIQLTGAGVVLGFRQEADGDLPGYKIEVQTVGVDQMNQDAFKVNQNRPNPFNGTTKILYEMEKATTVDFKVINLLGEIVYKNTYEANSGINNIIFDGSDLNEGVYMYTLAVGAKKVTKRMVISK